MGKILRFKEEPTLLDLEGLSVNGATFIRDKGFFQSTETLIMRIPHTFCFSTNLEVYKGDENCDLILVQFLTRGPEYWEMGDSFRRIGFRNPEIETQFKELCETLVTKGLAYWTEEQ